jgi:outer membrane lipopolysaccharide assembly protein LptE/RlpB
MKKLIYLLLLPLVVAVTACGGKLEKGVGIGNAG